MSIDLPWDRAIAPLIFRRALFESWELDHTGRPVAESLLHRGGLHDADYREAQVALDGLAAISITDRFG